MIVYRCDLCNEIRECTQRIIEDTQYDICSECWESLASKLKGKGRCKPDREVVLLPAPRAPQSPDVPLPSPFPGGPPKIYSGVEPVN
jgi:hypothetical protein